MSEPLYDDRNKQRASAEGLLLRAMPKVAAADLADKLDAASRQAWFLGKTYARDGYPGEREVMMGLRLPYPREGERPRRAPPGTEKRRY